MKKLFLGALMLVVLGAQAQDCQVKVSEQDEPMQKGKFEPKILNEFGDWMNINKEAIYATRPWKIFGEGPIAEADIKMKDEGFNEGAYMDATSEEKRFTQTDKALNGIAPVLKIKK